MCRDHTEFGVCQAGTSGVILDDDTIVLGSPGSFTWRGNIFSVNVSEEFLERDKTLYRSPIQNNEGPPVDMYSYLGKVFLMLDFKKIEIFNVSSY